MSGAIGALGAFGEGFARVLGSKRAKDERKALDAKLDGLLSRSEGAIGALGPMPLGVQGGGGADSGRAANTVTTFEAGGDKDAFIQAMMPHALRVSQATGLDPRLIIAQSAQETGWGRSAPNNNFFGIKSHGKSGGANLGTHEYVNGQRVNVTDSFRTYSDMGASVDDYGRFLQTNPRYKPMLSAQGLEAQIAALGQSGYATDPNYARTVMAIAQGIKLPAAQPAPTVQSITNRWPRPLGVGPT